METIDYISAMDNTKTGGMVDYDNCFTETQLISIKYYEDKEKYNEYYSILEELERIYLMDNHFGDLNRLYMNGVDIHFENLKSYILNNNIIGMILYGSDIKDVFDVMIADVQDIENNFIDDIYHLTIKSISKTILNDYLMIEHNLDILCDIANKNNEIKDYDDVCENFKNI
jgi:hypothetical protein